jgi:hypothetical protein
MVEDSRKLLTERGFKVSRRGEPGHLAVEELLVSDLEEGKMDNPVKEESAADIFARADERKLLMGLPYAGAVTPAEAWALQGAGAARILDVRTEPEWQFVGHVPDVPLIEWPRGGEARRCAPSSPASTSRSTRTSPSSSSAAAACARTMPRSSPPRRVREGVQHPRRIRGRCARARLARGRASWKKG